MPLFRNRLFSNATARSNGEIQKSDRDRFCCEWRGAPQWIQNSMCAGEIRKAGEMCLLILKVRLRLISVAGERDGLPCDIHQLCHPAVIYNMSAYTQRGKCTCTLTHNNESGFWFVWGSIWAQARMGCVTPPQRCRIPAGSLVTRRSSLLFALQVNGGGGVMLWRAGRSAGEAIDPRPIVEMVQYPHLLQWPLKQAHGNAHTQEWGSYWDGQRCHQWLPSCHSDMERLGPYERLCSPKRYLGAGAAETRQWLLMRGHNQMWKLSCTLTGSIVAKGTVILMQFFSGWR